MNPATYFLLALTPFLASSLYFHFRGRLRFKLTRQLGDYSTLLAPYNAFACLFTKGGNRLVHDLARFPELALLRDNWEVIRDEALTLLQDGQVKKSERQDDIVFYSFMKRGWKRFYLRWFKDFLPSARQQCPRTVGLLEQLSCVKGAMFAVLEPQQRLGKHRDPFAGTLRYHLGLVTPNSDECWLRLDDTQYVWRDGQDILFDSSYVHAAYNKTSKPRLVLFCDVERPMRGPISRAINRFVVRYVAPITQVQNEPGDPIGVGNRVFAMLKPWRTGIHALKQKSRAAYYGLKYGLAVGVVALLILASIL